MKVTLPIRTRSTLNMREHWAVRARTAKTQRQVAALSLWGKPKPKAPMTITLTRVGVRKLDSDNLAASLKHTQDGIADWLCIDDGDERLTWVYRQRLGKQYAVDVEFEGAE